LSLSGRLVDVGDLRLFVHRSGKRGGAPVVFVHGYMVGHYSLRSIVGPTAEAGFDVIAPDLPGCGESDRPSPRRYGYDGDSFVGTLLALLDALDVERAVLVGHSMGGAISLMAAARHPDRFQRLVLIDPLVYPYPLPIEGRLLLAPIVGLPLYRSLFTRGLLQSYLRRQIYKDPALVADDWVDYLWERLNRPGGMEATHATLRFVSEPTEVEQCLPRVRARTLIVWGEDDRLFPSAWASRLAGALAGASFHLVHDCGHSPPEEKPEELLAAVLPFLSAGEAVQSAPSEGAA
jgi:pimeloyl-ACP methyl ester carboxylesterase